MDSAMLLTSLKTLVEYVQMAINADEVTWWFEFILGLVFLILILSLLNSKRWRKPVVNIKDKRIENFEEWRKPVLRFGDFFDQRIKDFFRYKHINIDQDDWDVSCEIVDRILKIVVSEMRKEAIKRFPGLAIGKTLRKQGSSREGLKVCDPLEFDVLLPFLLENVKTNNDAVFDNNGCIIPGLFTMRIMNPDKLPSWWRKCELVSEERGKTYINTSNFHKKVFASLLDQTREGINKVLKKLTENTNDKYAVVRSVISPSLKITIHVHSENGLKSFKNILGHLEVFYNVRLEALVEYKQIDLEIDLVPGILLSIDEFPKNMLNQNSFISCERYGVMKWVNKKNHHIPKQDADLIWRNSTCGYEKCIFDTAQKNSSQLYVMTACRLLKWALRKVTSSTNNQLGSVLKSYHLKNLCFYCILFLTIPSERNRLSGVTEATGYFIEFIRLSLEAGNLPHFFHGNPYLSDIFPGSVFGEEKTKYNMFAMNSEETLVQARLGFKDFKRKLDGLYLERDQLDYKKIKLFDGHLHLQ